MSANPYPERISWGGVTLLSAIQGFEAYKRLTVIEAAHLCGDLSCVFRPHYPLAKAERNSCKNSNTRACCGYKLRKSPHRGGDRGHLARVTSLVNASEGDLWTVTV